MPFPDNHRLSAGIHDAKTGGIVVRPDELLDAPFATGTNIVTCATTVVTVNRVGGRRVDAAKLARVDGQQKRQ